MKSATITATIGVVHKQLPHNSRQTRRIPDYSSARECGNVILSRDASRAGRGNPGTKGAASATRGRFLLSGRYSMAAGSGQPHGWPVSFGPVFHPVVSPPPIAVEIDVADSTNQRSPT